jgi:hypothetical protein
MKSNSTEQREEHSERKIPNAVQFWKAYANANWLIFGSWLLSNHKTSWILQWFITLFIYEKIEVSGVVSNEILKHKKESK